MRLPNKPASLGSLEARGFCFLEFLAGVRLGVKRQYRRDGGIQQKSVATESRQMICTTIWQRISPLVVAIPVCPAYIVATLSVGIGAVSLRWNAQQLVVSIGAESDSSWPVLFRAVEPIPGISWL
ncbi:hypothetical protein [Pseudomonas tolaasii]|uniref:hypothetical protein n=1 Tax=Pseudomonas tolaasii TaxID=29442 RepID=UPI001C5F6C35|nr:hypothetical protein [Pseudomonas tolaasii]MBW4793130.1 hypothetical protein [Pseudomonas tolaasii]